MKTNLIFFALLLAVSVLLPACNDDDNNDGNYTTKEKTLLSKYPKAENITWKKSGDNKYDIATFTLPKVVKAALNDTVQVWFGQDENIRLVNQEISFSKLPELVQRSFEKTKCQPEKGNIGALLLNTLYADNGIWEIDDVCKLERDGVIAYKIEMEALAQDVEIDLYYDEQGILTKETPDDGEETPLEIPISIKEWVQGHYPDTEILDYEMEEEKDGIEHEVDLKIGKIVLEIVLIEKNKQLEIVEEEYNYASLDDLPEKVVAKFRELLATETRVSEADIDDITMEKENGNEVYSIELEKGELEITIKVMKDSQSEISGEIGEED